MSIRIGTAGWAVPRAIADRFPADLKGLQRYAARFDCAEINTTFYRPHRADTYARWRDSVPPGFRFAVKLRRTITHEARLADCRGELDAFVAEVAGLGEALGPLLVQLPPKLVFDPEVVPAFLEDLRARWAGPVAWEPRHASWFAPEVDAVFADHRIARVAADPPRHPDDTKPGGWSGLAYWRLHGSPRVYFSPYGGGRLAALAVEIAASPAEERWCVFDNTASGAAAADALDLKGRLGTFSPAVILRPRSGPEDPLVR
ncbi:MAG TPA: DUF72 domain-containing protein [Caulobacter sp.]|nr:DUF72 domain-containing protein [Caulobacter sp.]